MLNECTFIGRLGADPEIRRTQTGTTVASFRIACSEKWTDKATGERKERTEWISITCWKEGLCKAVESYLHKGDLVYVSGKLQTRKWQDRDGSERYKTEIVADKVTMPIRSTIPHGKDDDQQSNPPSKSEGPEPEIDDEIPF